MNENEHEEWYKKCRFIKDEMSFSTYKLFVKRALNIRSLYDEADKFTRTFYKWYVYANNDLNINQKNAVWNFLNHSIELPELFNVKLYVKIK